MAFTVEKLISHFHERLHEWVLALVITLFGLSLFINQDIFATSFYYDGLVQLFPDERVWGGIAIFIGILRLIFLTINGAWRKSSHLRALGAILSVIFWVVVYMSYATVGFALPVLALLIGAIIFDFHSIWVAAGDAGKSDTKSKRDDIIKDQTET